MTCGATASRLTTPSFRGLGAQRSSRQTASRRLPYATTSGMTMMQRCFASASVVLYTGEVQGSFQRSPDRVPPGLSSVFVSVL